MPSRRVVSELHHERSANVRGGIMDDRNYSNQQKYPVRSKTRAQVAHHDEQQFIRYGAEALLGVVAALCTAFIWYVWA